MSTLNEWTLPLNPQSPYSLYLQHLTSEFKGRLYYSKYIIDVIGELDLNQQPAVIREWDLPKNLFTMPPGYGSSPEGIALAPDNTIWSALHYGQRLLQLDPDSGVFNWYGLTRGTPGSSNYDTYPISYPADVMLDDRQNAWYVGSGVIGASCQGPLIGRLKADRKSADYWELSGMPALSPRDLWVKRDGEEVWFTLFNTTYLKTVPFLGQLLPSTNQVTYWYNSYPVGTWGAGAIGVVGDSPDKPQNIWFTFRDDGGNTGTYRLFRPNGTFFQFLTNGEPHEIALDREGNAWVSDWRGRISLIRNNADCGQVKFQSDTIFVKPQNRQVEGIRTMVKPQITIVSPTTQIIQPVENKCHADYPIPYPVAPNGIAVSDSPSMPTIYFAQGSGIVIGQLLP